jgi:hypothetical protein
MVQLLACGTENTPLVLPLNSNGFVMSKAEKHVQITPGEMN